MRFSFSRWFFNDAVFKEKENLAATDISFGDLPEWDLTDLYPSHDGPEFKADLEKAQKQAREFEVKYKGKILELTIENQAIELARSIQSYEQLDDLIGRIMSFAFLYYAGDNTDAARVKFFADTRDIVTSLSSHLIFFELELNAVSKEQYEGLFKASEELAYYKPWIDELGKSKPHQLSEDIERLFHEKSVTASGAWNRLFDETMARLKFNLDGKEVGVEEILNQMTDSDGDKRACAAKEISRVLGDNLPLFTLITNTLAKDKEISDRWRKFDDIADSRHLSNSVEREVVDALVQTVNDAYPRISHRYYKLKAKWFGVEQLNFWDRNAPLPHADNRIIPWEQAQSIVLDAFGQFSPKVEEIAKEFFDKNWIDAPVRPGKSSGAFAHPTVPSAHPYVMVNYLGKTRDVMTVAHELGHGVHQVLAADQGSLMASTPLTLAETASVFGEMLTFQKLLNATENPRQRQAMLASKVEDMINTVVRQIAFYQFERKVHAARRDGELTSEQLNDMWLSVQKTSLGDAVKLNEGYESYWTYIPHFIHSPFYVYAYAFGDCLVNSLYAVYQNADDGFAHKYLDLLKAGGSKHHSELLAPFGLDATDPDFWAQGLGLLEGFIDELEQLEEQLG